VAPVIIKSDRRTLVKENLSRNDGKKAYIRNATPVDISKRTEIADVDA
jgi:hypothetical protein